MLGDDVDILEVTLDRVALENRRAAARGVNAFDDLRGQAYRVRARQTQRRALGEADGFVFAGVIPDIRHGIHQERAPRLI